MDIKYIILVTDSLGFARKVVDPSVYSGQAHFLAVYVINLLSELKYFFIFLVFYDFSLVFLFPSLNLAKGCNITSNVTEA